MEILRYIFIGGAHKSGSTFLGQLLGQSDEISTFECTGAPMDEGQWLQSSLPRDTEFGELLFGLTNEAQLIEHDVESTELVNELLKDWEPHWDLHCNLLLEKSPINALRTRLLQTLFPGSVFLITIRDPRSSFIACSKTMPHITPEIYFKNWCAIYSKFREDSIFLNHYSLVYYEELIHNPIKVLRKLENLLGIKLDSVDCSCISSAVDLEYMEQWKKLKGSFLPTPMLYGY